MLMQDTREMRPSRVEIPTVTCRQEKAIVEAGEGRIGLLALGYCIFDLYSKTLRNNCIGTEEWHHDRTIPLSKDFHWRIIGTAKGYVLLRAIPQDSSQLASSLQQMPAAQYFTLDLKTFMVERL
ncbi:hypothetical protein BAE44_0023183, partial [Dichanthelium oligosanthes]